MSENLTQAIKNFAQAMPSADAVIEMRQRLHCSVISNKLNYKEFDQRIDQYSAKFQQKGIRTGNRVLMLVPPGLKMMCSFFALVRIGAIPILIDSGMSRKKFIQIVHRSRPDFIICSSRTYILIRLHVLNLPGKVIAIGKSFAKKMPPSTTIHPPEDNDIAAILFTSGSTGPAKGVVYLQRHFRGQLSKLKTTYQLTPHARDVTLLPAFMLFNPIFGRTTIIPDINYRSPATFQASGVVETITNNCATSSFGAPVLWNKIATYCILKDIQLRSLEQIFLAGMSASTEVLEKIHKIAPNAKIYTPYGATECLPICSITADEILADIRPLQENGAGTCLGKPVEGVSVKILPIHDEAIEQMSSELPLGFTGEIVVSGDNVTETYDALPDATKYAKIHSEGKIWHRMGDLGFLDQRGRLWLCGRKVERVVTSDGEEYFADCIEPLFYKNHDIERAALIRYVTRHGVQPAIVVLPKHGHYPYFPWQKWTFRKKLRDLALRFPKTSRIQHFFFVTKLPVDPRHNAKIHRLALSRTFSRT